MAATVEARALTETHRKAQIRLATLTAATMRDLWRLLDPADLDATTPGWLDATTRLVAAQHATSATLARRYYDRYRAAEIGASVAGRLPDPGVNLAAVRTSLTVTGPVNLRRSIVRGRTVDTASRYALNAAIGAATRHVTAGSRDTLTAAVAADRRALGWARATSGNPCAFCAMLAGRGPTFRTEAAGAFEAHDGCNCTPEPVFASDAPFPGQKWADLYASEAKGNADPINAFRRAYEGRQ